ncbi:MAG: gliding motility protein GldL [Bacteroidales bacterium]|jgi:gliding motility-associated protein GldL|nr:gliding motility protein GldL [Bacteroidales bacterium]
MGLAELTQSSGWKKFMAKLYGWGASVVIIGALFKIQHWPGAGAMLTLGLSTEAIIFFFSAFEPIHEELDWTLVYPELAGMTDPDELDQIKGISRSTGALERFDDLVGGLGGIDPTLIKNLGSSFEKLNNTATSISDVSQVTVATDKYVKNINAAADSAGSLTNTFQQSAAGMQQAANSLNSSSQAFLSIGENSKGYVTQLDGMHKNLSALNAVYELQLRDTNDHLQKAKAAYSGLDQILNDMKSSVEATRLYREEMANLTKNLTALNTIYGNMLSAMAVRG